MYFSMKNRRSISNGLEEGEENTFSFRTNLANAIRAVNTVLRIAYIYMEGKKRRVYIYIYMCIGKKITICPKIGF